MAADEVNSKRQIRKTAELAQIIAKDECKLRFKKVAAALKKEPSERTVAENELLSYSDDVIKEIQKRAQNREKLKTRQLEIEDPEEVLHWKCRQLAAAIKQSKCLVVYTGAGISTAASIPDYRGPNGVWTLLQQGKQVKTQDLSDAEPTSTHMALTTLYNVKLVKHVVSQNCDGLHLRSGLPRKALSEVHGNMYIERCTECQAEYIRLFDVTEKTGIRRHKTDRKCVKCKGALKDTIIHFGEKAPLDGIYNWLAARKMVDKADMILCLGSSLKVLRKYACLWSMHQPLHKRPKLYIVNLQWTPKDELAMLKINGKCDEVLTRIMDYLGFNLPPYKSWFSKVAVRKSLLLKSDGFKTSDVLVC
ncbi:NAD-dependent protein deacetylase sirtuin-7-like isoform X2 [Tubulanus polymorphus]|uniref:NAD-dependent protein deacetylase sirtuin-7-like isoform X2 n=1 Tax=Tubulanus polymorphus TaxID=672921 RepID=UPI003DA5F9E4